MSNGEEYLLNELASEVKARETINPDFSKCGVGADFAESNHRGTTLLLKSALIQQRKAVEQKNNGFVLGGVKITGAAGGFMGAIYAIGKVHNWW